MNELTAEGVRYWLKYDPETGVFTWRVSPKRVPAGSVAGSVGSHGYVAIVIAQQKYLAHRLVWLYETGEWPPNEIDHIDCGKLNNRFSNLRLATSRQNSANVRLHRDSATGLKGATFHKGAGKYMAQITVNYERIYLGLHDTAEAAHDAYMAAAERAFGEYARAE